jgi:hypothetical protein
MEETETKIKTNQWNLFDFYVLFSLTQINPYDQQKARLSAITNQSNIMS